MVCVCVCVWCGVCVVCVVCVRVVWRVCVCYAVHMSMPPGGVGDTSHANRKKHCPSWGPPAGREPLH